MDTGPESVDADVCIVGAGAIGCYLASCLARRGLSIVILEAGPMRSVDEQQIGFDAIHLDRHYHGATSGRYFGVGGSTSKWGGALVPHTELDIGASDDRETDWKRVVSVVNEHSTAVLRALGYAGEVDFNKYASQELFQVGDALRNAGFVPQAGLYLPVSRKNLRGLLDRDFEGQSSPRVFFNAVAKTWRITASAQDRSRIVQLAGVAKGRQQVSVRAKHFVVAAGAIECARILLEANSASNGTLLPRRAAIGRSLGDHLSIAIAAVATTDAPNAGIAFAPRFSGAWMRSFRFVERERPPGAPRAFSHLVFHNSGAGFAMTKELVGAFQARRIPRVPATVAIRGATEVLRFGFSRFFQSRLYIPKGTPVDLQLDMEQPVCSSRRLELSNRLDEFGRQKLEITWAISASDESHLQAAAKRIIAKWRCAGSVVPRLEARALKMDGTKIYDAYHPVGTCRMGDDEEAVLSPDMQVRGVDNLWVAGTSVLSSAGSANPTFTALCLAHRLADHLFEGISRDQSIIVSRAVGA